MAHRRLLLRRVPSPPAARRTTTGTLREDYLTALLAGDAIRARHVVDRAAGDGVPIAELYLDVLGPAMEELGERWEAGELGVGREHSATSITQGIMGAIGPRMRVPPDTGRLAVLACTPGERHALGVLMAGDFLESAGWEVLNLGPSLPAAELATLVESEQPDLVGLSTGTVDQLAGAEAALAALRMLEVRPYVVVGGRAWSSLPEGAPQALGADARVDRPTELVELVVRRFPPVED